METSTDTRAGVEMVAEEVVQVGALRIELQEKRRQVDVEYGPGTLTDVMFNTATSDRVRKVARESSLRIKSREGGWAAAHFLCHALKYMR